MFARKGKRSLAFLLTLVMVLSLIPFSALATDYSELITKQGDTLYYLQDGTETTSSGDWMVSTSKTIQDTDTENQYDITLQVQSKTQVVPTTTVVGADVVLVLDVSTSMDEIVSDGNEILPFNQTWVNNGMFGGGHWEIVTNSTWTSLHDGGAQTRWEKMKDSIQTFLTAFLADSNNRVAIVVYGGSNADGQSTNHAILTTSGGGYWFTDANAAFDKIDYDAVCQYSIDKQSSLSGNSMRKAVFGDTGTDYGATNIQAGFWGAGEALGSKRSAALPYVVFMSDGQANGWYRKNTGNSNSYVTSGSYKPVNADSNSTAYATEAANAQLNYLVANQSASVFGIAFDTSMSGSVFANSNMTSIAFSSSSGTTVLDNIFNTITEQIEIEAEPWTVRDNMSNLVILDQSSVEDNDYVTVAADGKSFDWSIADAAADEAYDLSDGIYTYTMTYRINVDPTQVSAWLDGGTVKSNATNGTTSLSFKLVVGGVEDPFTRVAPFDIPEVTVNTYTVTFVDGLTNDTIKAETILYNGSATPPVKPSHTGYSTGDWEGTWQNVTQDETVVVNYEIYKYTIQYKVDGTVYDTVSNVDYDTPYANTAVPSDPTKESTAAATFRFDGWVPADSNYGENVQEDRVYNALFTPVTRQYTVTFLEEDGSTEYRQDSYDYNSSIPGANIPVATKDEDDHYTYTFSGWAVPEGKTYTTASPVTEDMVFTATFNRTAKQYEIETSIDNSGTITPTMSNYTAGTNPVIQWTPAEGYKVVSVTIDGDSVAVSPTGGSYTFTDICANHTVTVETEKKTYTVQFIDGDDVIASGTVEHGDSYGSAPDDPTRESTDETVYTFLHWAPHGSYSLDDLENVTQDMTFEAIYTSAEREYTVTFYAENGVSVINRATYNFDDPITVPGDPSKTPTAQYYYTFAGWEAQGDYNTESHVASDMDFVATFEEHDQTYDVTFVLTGGPDGNITVTVDEDVPYGGDATLPTEAEIEAALPTGYLFNDDWSDNYTNIEQNETVYGSISIKTFTVRFFVDGEQLGDDQTVNYGESASDPGYTAPDHFTFSGWDPELGPITTDTDFYGTTAPIDYTVTFYKEDGTTVVKALTEPYETDVSDQIPEGPEKTSTDRYSYTFEEWAPVEGSGSDLDDLTSLDRNQSFIATYSENLIPYSVTYYEADGTTVISSLSKSDYEYGADFVIAAGLDGYETASTVYTWAGWEPGSAAYGTDTESVTQNMTFTATFNETPRTYTVTASIDNGTILGAGTYNYGSDVTVSWNPAAGYHVTGVTVDGIPQDFDFDTTREWPFDDLAGDHNVVVSTAVNQYTVKFLNDDLDTISTQTVNYGGSASQPGDPSKTDATGKYTYDFTGWTVPADAGYTLENIGNVTQNMTFTASYETEHNSATLTVHHVDSTGTNDLSAYDSTTSVNVGDPYDANPLSSGSLPTDYKLVSTAVTPTGATEDGEEMPAGGVTVTYTYGPKSSVPVTVNYIQVAEAEEGAENTITIGGVTYSTVKTLGTATRSYLEDDSSYDVTDLIKATYGDHDEYTFLGDDAQGVYAGGLDGAVTINLYYTINQHTVTINYVYANGSQAADPYEASYDYGSPYYVTSPSITSYTPDQTTVEGTLTGDTTITVTYTYSGGGGGGGDDTPTYYTVQYKFSGERPDDVTLPASASYVRNTLVEIADGYDDVTTADGVWHFNGWNKTEDFKVTSSTTITGTWTYTANETDITEEEPPLSETPTTEEPIAEPPVTEEPGTEIEEPEVPLGNLPQTGTTAEAVNPMWTLGMLALSLSMAAAGLTITFGRKKDEEQK